MVGCQGDIIETMMPQHCVDSIDLAAKSDIFASCQ